MTGILLIALALGLLAYLAVGLAVAVKLDLDADCLLWWPLYLAVWLVIRNRGQRR